MNISGPSKSGWGSLMCPVSALKCCFLRAADVLCASCRSLCKKTLEDQELSTTELQYCCGDRFIRAGLGGTVPGV